MADRETWRVPQQARAAFTSLAKLSESEFSALFDAITPSTQLQTYPKLISAVSEHSAQLSSHAEDFVIGIMSLIRAASEDTADSKSISAELSRDGSLDLDLEEQRVLKLRLASLLQSRTLGLSAKALDLSTEYEHVFSDARVLTDIRPVFPDDDKSAPAAAVIVNNLKLNYYGSDGNVREFHLALDAADLLRLSNVVAVALNKTDSLKKLLSEASLASWGADG